MHFSIPDTQELKDENGTLYTSFNIHINGVFHCSVRYSALYAFHEQLQKEFGSKILAPFPPKKLLPLSGPKLDERRLMLEKYIQIVSQEPAIARSDAFNGFLLSAQQETQKEQAESVTLEVFLMNGHRIPVNIMSTDQTDEVLEAVASQIDLTDEFVYYFGLYLVKKEDKGDNSIVRKFQDFESPYISLKSANKEATHRIVLRKSYWDPAYDDDLLENKVAMNLLYVQVTNDVERQWILATKDQLKHLATLQERNSKREYLRMARTLKYYGYIHFRSSLTDYPKPNSKVLIAAGNHELNFRVEVSPGTFKEGVFKITRIRCWRITTTINNGSSTSNTSSPSQLELSFEYLMAKDKLQWVTISSDQAILMSMCLQGMVEELINKKQGRKVKRPQDKVKKTRKGLTRESSQTGISRQVSLPEGLGSQNGDAVTNSAFDDAIGDDDL
ncbi:hypothetical protein ACJMK2_002244 [Sinanodonta woodiana]|uniref:Sorting nexin-17 n=1 Tax=Sinanodonta woodiana TaxID=1069815 RepID=A0ABD3XXU4_SINWO